MRIRMIGTASGPDGHYRSDQIYDVPEALGKQLVEQLQAVEESGDGPTNRPEADTTPAPQPEFTSETGALRSKQRRF